MGIDYLIRNVNELINNYNDYANVDQGAHADAVDTKILGIVFTMIQEYAGVPMSSQRTFMNQVRSRKEMFVFESYIKRNDTLFAEAPRTGLPVVLNGYANGSHQSVVDGLENVTNEFALQLAI